MMKYIIDIQETKNCTQCPFKVTDYEGSVCKLSGKEIDNLAFKRLPDHCQLVKYNG